MVGPSNPKALHTLQNFSMKQPPTPSSSSSSSTLTSMKLKTLLQTFIFSHLYRIARTLTKAKSFLLAVLKDFQLLHFLEFPIKKNKNKNKLIFGSFRLHYNWCSSHVMPMPMPMPPAVVPDSFTTNYLYYDSSWNSIMSTECEESSESELSGYLHWLEEKGKQDCDINEIDKLADMFIASCHEKFRLEKQESYRRFQEMMARSV